MVLIVFTLLTEFQRPLFWDCTIFKKLNGIQCSVDLQSNLQAPIIRPPQFCYCHVLGILFWGFPISHTSSSYQKLQFCGEVIVQIECSLWFTWTGLPLLIHGVDTENNCNLTKFKLQWLVQNWAPELSCLFRAKTRISWKSEKKLPSFLWSWT